MKKYNEFLKHIESILGKSATTASELEAVGGSMFGNDFQGVYSAKALKNIESLLHNHSYCILNTKSEMPGEHWVAFGRENDNICAYDSFGRTVSGFHNAENDAEQAILEANCGQRCLAWLGVFHTLGEGAALTI